MPDRAAFCFAGWQDLFAVFGTAREVALRLGRGAELRRAFEGGALSAEFLAQVEDSIGLNAEARERRSREGNGNYEEGSTSGEVETDFFADLSPDTTFSIAPSSPERDARPLPELGIPDGRLGGDGRADWRRAVRDAIAADLQGTSIVNKDTGESIRFTSQSKGESVSKLRKETGFRAALRMRAIAEAAVRIGSIAAGKQRTGTNERFDYFALPVKIDGRRAIAWFNTRVPSDGEAVFYEFGLYEKKWAQATQGTGETFPLPGVPQLGPAGTIGEFLAEIKETLPAAVKVAGEGSSINDPGRTGEGSSGAPSFSIDFLLHEGIFKQHVAGLRFAPDSREHARVRETLHGAASQFDGARLRSRVYQSREAALDVFRERTGLEITFFEAIGYDRPTGGFYQKSNPRRIFVSVRSQAPLGFIAVHEWGHAVLNTPGLVARYWAFARSLRPYLDEGAYQEKALSLLEDYDQREIPVEMVNNILGDALAAEPYWGADGIAKDWPAVVRLAREFFEGTPALEPEGLSAAADEELSTGRRGDPSGIKVDLPGGVSFSLGRAEAAGIRAKIEAQVPLEVSTEGISATMRAKEALRWAEEGGVTGMTSHPEIGEIAIRKRGVKNAIGHLLNPRKAAALLKMKELISRSTVMQFVPRASAADSFRLAGRIRIDGTDYVARIVVDTDANGNRFYNHELSDLKELRETKDPQALIPGVGPEGQQIGVEELEDTGKLLQWIYGVKSGEAGSTAADTSFSVGQVPSFLRPLDSNNQTRNTTNDESTRDPARILGSALSGGVGGPGIRTDAGKRRKHGRQLASHADLLAWAERKGRILDPDLIDSRARGEQPGGGEHKILTDAATRRVVKLTKPGLFGAQGEDAGAYLERWALHNVAFRDDVSFEGFVTLPGEDLPRAVISQRFVQGRDATAEEQADALNERGFHEMPDGKWIHPVRGIAVWDTITPGNAIFNESGVHFIDLQVMRAPAEELAELRQRTGIGRQTSFSLGAEQGLGEEGRKRELQRTRAYGEETESVWYDLDDFKKIASEAKAKGFFKYLKSGEECAVVSLGERGVVKFPEKKDGILVLNLPQGRTRSPELSHVEDRVRVIRALGGLRTSAIRQENGGFAIVQELGTPISNEEFKLAILPLGHVPRMGQLYEITIGGRRYHITDLKPDNFLKDREGVIRVSDPVVGEIVPGVSLPMMLGESVISLDRPPDS